MKEYYAIVIGTGSAMNFLSVLKNMTQKMKIAVIDKDEPGGICLTKGCIPSKLLLYPAELVREIEKAIQFGIDVEIRNIDFKFIMERMRKKISEEIEMIGKGLSSDPKIDYYPDVAQFIAPHTLKVGDEIITSKMIFLCTGSRPMIPQVKGLDETGYLTSDTVLKMTELPETIGIMGGGFIAAEYAHFFSAMGSKVTIIGRNPMFLPNEEPEVSDMAKKNMSGYMQIITDHEIIEVQRTDDGKKKMIARNRKSGDTIELVTDEILVAAGRSPNTDMLHPEKGGIKTDGKGWIDVNEYFETSSPHVWAFGDANGKYLFKHVANYESVVVYRNALMKQKVKVDYHAVPYAIFSYPEISGAGMKEKEAIEKYGEEKVLIGFYMYQDTAKGDAMEVKDCFVKVILEKETHRILGAHIIGPSASILIQEIVNLMYTPEQNAAPISIGMHIHPALSEVVDRAFSSLMLPDDYHHAMKHLLLEH
jgi:mycothione reductase